MTMSPDKVRTLTAAELGAALPPPADAPPPISAASDDAVLPDDDPILVKVRHAMEDGYAGVILTGVPGTGKSRHASLIARKLTNGDEARFEFVQFHPSYQYEDFVEGYLIQGSDFTRQLKTFGKLCDDASQDTSKRHILVIDEISRTDVARVFGEAFTYIERSKRGLKFTLASGTPMVVPENVFLIATMNPWDRGVDELDVALERRFAFVDMRPDRAELHQLLADNGLDGSLIDAAVAFFDFLQDQASPRCHLGHGYFVHARDRESLLRVWDFQLAHVLERASGTDRGAFARIERRWNDLVVNSAAPPA
jgi:5-methylcytosine-specific restriction protein B